MKELFNAISQYKQVHGDYPRIQVSEQLYNSMRGSLHHLEIEINNDIEVWDLLDADPVNDYCCGARVSEAGCCEW